MPADSAATLTFSLQTIVQVLLPVILTGLGAIAWFIKRMVARLEADIEELADEHDRLREECVRCREARQKDHEHLLCVNGKFGGRLSKVEGKLGI